MDPINDGGPAFPTFEPVEEFRKEAGRYETVYLSQGGMSMRDYFAAKALPSFIEANASNRAAAFAYQIADAMIKARAERSA